MVRILGFIEQNQAKSLVPLSEVEEATFTITQELKPPLDSQLLAHIDLVLSGKLGCTEAEVPLASIKPYDLDFALPYPLDTVNPSLTLHFSVPLAFSYGFESSVISTIELRKPLNEVV